MTASSTESPLSNLAPIEVTVEGPLSFFGEKSVFSHNEGDINNAKGIYLWCIRKADSPNHFFPHYVGRSLNLRDRLFYYASAVFRKTTPVYNSSTLALTKSKDDLEKALVPPKDTEDSQYLGIALEFLRSAQLFYAILHSEEDCVISEKILINALQVQPTFSNKRKNFNTQDSSIRLTLLKPDITIDGLKSGLFPAVT